MLSLVSQVSNFYSALRRCGIIAVFGITITALLNLYSTLRRFGIIADFGISIARYGAAASLPSCNFYSALRRFHLQRSYVSVFGL